MLVGRKRNAEQFYRPYGDFTTTSLFPLPSCQGSMRVIAVIEDQEVIRRILTHFGLWPIKARRRPVAHVLPDLAAAPFND